MRLTIAGKITIEDAPPELSGAIKEALTLENPAYWQAINRSPHSRCFLSPHVKYYAEKGGKLTIGRGLEARV